MLVFWTVLSLYRYAVKRIAKAFADNMKRLRKEKSLSQQALAERVGVSVITIQNYEAQRRWPSPEMNHELAKSLGVAESELFTDPESEKAALSPKQVLLAVSEALGFTQENKVIRNPVSRRSGKGQSKP